MRDGDTFEGHGGRAALPAPPGRFRSGPVVLEHAGLFTDLYELTMAASYFREGMTGDATFSLFARRLPPARSFLIAVGLEDVLRYLEAFRFDDEAIAYLRSLDLFEPGFLDVLRDLRFTGDAWAVPEGTPVFADEPLIEVTAPIIESQLVETAVINLTHAPTAVASKAVRSVIAAEGRSVVDFGLRRSPGLHEGMAATRAALIAGFDTTSNVLAGMTYGATPAGTMAHSYVSAFETEIASFRAFASAFPDRTVLLIDTYDTMAGAVKAAEVAREMEARGHRLVAVRLDSGDVIELSVLVRAVLDDAGLRDVRIMASGGLDEAAIARCVRAGAPIDAFGVGTRVVVSADAPYLDMAYKLVRYAGRDVLKLSEGKATLPGEKQVYRRRVPGPSTRVTGDQIARRTEGPPDAAARPLLQAVMRAGAVVAEAPALDAIRTSCARQVAALPEAVRRLDEPGDYPVALSAGLAGRRDALREEARRREAAGRANRPEHGFTPGSAPVHRRVPTYEA